ncbi:MAG: endonuclease NucS [Nanoarchaeota archaeon]
MTDISDEWVVKMTDAISRRDMIVLSSTCEIEYHGRAHSHLPEGDRVIMIKPDQTLIIHQPRGSAPVNYMKAKSSHLVVREPDAIYIRSANPKLKDYLNVRITDVHFFHCHRPKDERRIELFGNERDMSDYLFEHPEEVEEGFVPLSREEHTRYGFIDLFGHDRNGNIIVVECKRYHADPAAVTQLRRYVERIKDAKGVLRVRGILCSPTVSQNALKMLDDWGLSHKAVYPPKRMVRAKDQRMLFDFSPEDA